MARSLLAGEIALDWRPYVKRQLFSHAPLVCVFLSLGPVAYDAASVPRWAREQVAAEPRMSAAMTTPELAVAAAQATATTNFAAGRFAVSIKKPSDEETLKRTGANIVVRSARYVVLMGNENQLAEVRERGYVLVPLQQADLVWEGQLAFRVLVGNADQIQEIYDTVSDLWPFAGSSVPNWAHGRAYPFQLQLLRLRGFRVELCDTNDRCK